MPADRIYAAMRSLVVSATMDWVGFPSGSRRSRRRL